MRRCSTATLQESSNFGKIKMFLITIIFALVVSNAYGIKIEVIIKPSTECKEHTVSDDNLKIDYVSVFHTDQKKKILSAAILPVRSSFGANGININQNYNNHDGRIMADVLKDDPKGLYHVILNVRAVTIDKETAITYFYTKKTMDWHQSTEANREWDPKLYHRSPFLPGDVTVRINGRTVINRPDHKDLCYNSYAWIPHHGIYLLNNRKEWTFMLYYPHYTPQYLT